MDILSGITAKDSAMANFDESKIDVRLLQKAEYSNSSVKEMFPGAGSRDFRVYFSDDAYNSVQKHAYGTTSVEIGGVLVGHWGKDDDGPFVAVTEIIRCDAATSKSGEVTFTHEAWNVVNREMDTRFADLKIVGWYHSHPGFGIFLSERDRFIHEHFFGNPGQIAYVVDPLGETEGVFAWSGGKPSLWPHFWVGRGVRTSTEGGGEQKFVTPPNASATGAAVEPSAMPKESLLLMIQRTIMYALIFMIGFLLARIWNGWEQRIFLDGMVARFGPSSILRIGLHDNLHETELRLSNALQAIQILNANLADAKGEDADKKRKQWNEVYDSLQNTMFYLREIQDNYGLTPEEESAITAIVQTKIARQEAEFKKLQEQRLEESKKAEAKKKEQGAKPKSEEKSKSSEPAKQDEKKAEEKK
jgi:proteasome lid subunit RPN8/RPN11